MKRTPWRRLAGNFLMVLIAVLFALSLAEGGLRILYAGNPEFLSKNYQSGSFLFDLPQWKVWHLPNKQITHRRDCFEVNYSSNSLGMRGPEIDTAGVDIAFLGDSFLEGYGVNDNSTALHHLDQSWDHADPLNFGTSGGFGTVHQVALYENFVRYLKPEAVVLVVLNYNDFYDNTMAIGEGLVSASGQFLYPKTSGLQEVQRILAEAEQTARNEAYLDDFFVVNALRKGLVTLSGQLQLVFNTRLFDFNRRLAEAYTTQSNADLKTGLHLFSQSLVRLDSMTEADEIPLIVVNLSDPYQIDQNWLELMQVKFDEPLQPDLPNKEIGQLCEALGIQYLDMYPYAMQYIQKEELGFPYLSYTCNRHYSPEGQRLLADFLDEELSKALPELIQ
jgi:hypothetical protein